MKSSLRGTSASTLCLHAAVASRNSTRPSSTRVNGSKSWTAVSCGTGFTSALIRLTSLARCASHAMTIQLWLSVRRMAIRSAVSFSTVDEQGTEALALQRSSLLTHLGRHRKARHSAGMLGAVGGGVVGGREVAEESRLMAGVSHARGACGTAGKTWRNSSSVRVQAGWIYRLAQCNVNRVLLTPASSPLAQSNWAPSRAAVSCSRSRRSSREPFSSSWMQQLVLGSMWWMKQMLSRRASGAHVLRFG